MEDVEMKAAEREVKKMYPQAFFYRGWIYEFNQVDAPRRGYGIKESTAWGDALRRIKAGGNHESR